VDRRAEDLGVPCAYGRLDEPRPLGGVRVVTTLQQAHRFDWRYWMVPRILPPPVAPDIWCSGSALGVRRHPLYRRTGGRGRGCLLAHRL